MVHLDPLAVVNAARMVEQAGEAKKQLERLSLMGDPAEERRFRFWVRVIYYGIMFTWIAAACGVLYLVLFYAKSPNATFSPPPAKKEPAKQTAPHRPFRLKDYPHS